MNLHRTRLCFHYRYFAWVCLELDWSYYCLDSWSVHYLAVFKKDRPQCLESIRPYTREHSSLYCHFYRLVVNMDFNQIFDPLFPFFLWMGKHCWSFYLMNTGMDCSDFEINDVYWWWGVILFTNYWRGHQLFQFQILLSNLSVEIIYAFKKDV